MLLASKATEDDTAKVGDAPTPPPPPPPPEEPDVRVLPPPGTAPPAGIIVTADQAIANVGAISH